MDDRLEEKSYWRRFLDAGAALADEVWDQVPSGSQLAEYLDSLPKKIAQAASWPELEHWLEWFLGGGSFYLGVGVGIAKGLGSLAADLVKLVVTLAKLEIKLLEVQKDFALAGVYQLAQPAEVSFWRAPGGYVAHQAALEAMRWMGPELKASHERVAKLLQELEALILHPREDVKKAFQELKAALNKTGDDWVQRWKLYLQYARSEKLSEEFRNSRLARWPEKCCLK